MTWENAHSVYALKCRSVCNYYYVIFDVQMRAQCRINVIQNDRVAS